MFSPDGFINLRLIYEQFQHSMFDHFWGNFFEDVKDHCEHFEDLTFRDEDDCTDDELTENERYLLGDMRRFDIGGDFPMILKGNFPADDIEWAMLKNIGRHVYACSPRGEKVRLNLELSGFAGEILWADFAFDDRGKLKPDEAMQMIRYESNIYHQTIGEFRDGFYFVTPDDEDPEQFMKNVFVNNVLKEAHSQIAHFHNRQTCTISLKGYEYLERVGLSRPYLQTRAEILQDFEGWALCVPDEVAEQAPNMIKTMLIEQPQTNPKSGRPRAKRDNALKAYQRLFPSGHGNTPEKHVLRQIVDETGEQISIETLRRAISEAN